jgi:hypothetical protein
VAGDLNGEYRCDFVVKVETLEDRHRFVGIIDDKTNGAVCLDARSGNRLGVDPFLVKDVHQPRERAGHVIQLNGDLLDRHGF